jgi:SPP1 gp7 family putative phage head morphogenesis protein
MICSCSTCIPVLVTNARQARRVSGFRLDPTRTTSISRAFTRDMEARAKALTWSINKFVGTEDSFGLAPKKNLSFNAREYEFLTNPSKLKTFMSWLKSQIDKSLLWLEPGETPWTAKYVNSAYRKGVTNAHSAVNVKDLTKGADFVKGSQAQFLRDAFSSPEQLSKVQMLATRSFENIRGITGPMAAKLNTILADGIAKGLSPKQMAKQMTEQMDISLSRARTIARTEVIHAHAEGQLDSLKALGVESVGVQAEWITAGDGKVCPTCEELSAKSPYTVTKARGMIPAHPNCRCSWIPYINP